MAHLNGHRRLCMDLAYKGPFEYKLFAPVPCNASINKNSTSHFCPVRVRIHLHALLTDSCFIKMPDEPVPPRPMLHKLQLCFKQPNLQYSADELSLACVSLALYSKFVYCPSLGYRNVFTR